jgi:hypothetical protein
MFGTFCGFDVDIDVDVDVVVLVLADGIYPFSIAWAPLTSAFTTRFPGFEMDVFGATVLVSIPFLRDVGMWVGGREVSRTAITHALSHNRSACLVPGGQAEMRLSRSTANAGHHRIELVRRHTGFIRLALIHGVDLVPIFSFGEHELHDNVYYPSMQKWTTKVLGFGMTALVVVVVSFCLFVGLWVFVHTYCAFLYAFVQLSTSFRPIWCMVFVISSDCRFCEFFCCCVYLRLSAFSLWTLVLAFSSLCPHDHGCRCSHPCWSACIRSFSRIDRSHRRCILCGTVRLV